MAEERFRNTDESISTAKFAVQDGAMTMRQAGRIFRLDPAPLNNRNPHKKDCKCSPFVLLHYASLHSL